ncbi:YkgJ family cysteine cluster protein [Deinococcus roseus]|uniref:Zinc/iron-chelating domain-containing protein n=1 Tax=Deinococcus roseus TaxID=392414 RepID=A0ABQ2CUG6_9DEIO|nr:YkgJ family cysteine cluster protein [Deinococcus roseus]GGJ21977.1 zinc/iron-chelating domain-containing protein [Deinococcus roseus]
MSRFDAPPEHLPRSSWLKDCTACGACCAAPDISTLQKPLGVRCGNLQDNCLCAIYQDRPAVCRNYQPDWVCGEVAPLLTLDERVKRFLQIYGLSP